MHTINLIHKMPDPNQHIMILDNNFQIFIGTVKEFINGNYSIDNLFVDSISTISLEGKTYIVINSRKSPYA